MVLSFQPRWILLYGDNLLSIGDLQILDPLLINDASSKRQLLYASLPNGRNNPSGKVSVSITNIHDD